MGGFTVPASSRDDRRLALGEGKPATFQCHGDGVEAERRFRGLLAAAYPAGRTRDHLDGDKKPSRPSVSADHGSVAAVGDIKSSPIGLKHLKRTEINEPTQQAIQANPKPCDG
jgi:hypothetical protein